MQERLHLRNGLMIGFHFVSRYFGQHAPRVAAKLRAKKVVEMGVRVEQMLYCQIVLDHKRAYLLTFCRQKSTAVNDYRLAAFVPKQIAILFNKVNGKNLVIERAHIYLQKERAALPTGSALYVL